MRNRMFVVITLALACGGGAEHTTTPSSGDEPTVVPDPEPEPVSGLTAEQRAVLTPELRRYGSGWTLSEVEKAYTVEATAIEGGYDLLFVARGHSGLFVRKRILIGGQFNGTAILPPEGPELTVAERDQVDAVLRETRELWLIGSNRVIDLRDVSQGLTAIVGDLTLETRLHEGRAVLMTRNRDHDDPFVWVVDLDARTILEAREHSMPPVIGPGMLSAADVTFIDQSLRQHGDFGVYGNVTQGLRSLVANFRVQVSRQDDHFDIGVYPHDGHGHELNFSIVRSTGEIENMSAGHSISPDEME